MKCPVCLKEVKRIGVHLSSNKSIAHEKYIISISKKIDSFINKKEMLVTDITERMMQDTNINWYFLITKRMKVLDPHRGKSLLGEKRKGKNNPVFKKGVIEKIKKSVSKRWDEGKYRDRINGMLGLKGELHPNFKPENHTSLYLAKTKYIDFLSKYEDVSVCQRCGSNNTINIHHIDEDRNNFLPSNLEPLCVPCHSHFHYSLQKQPFITVAKKFSFAASHRLPGYKGMCSNWHGHEWVIEISIRKRVDKKTGMVIDFSTLKDTVDAFVIHRFDHTCLNDHIENPTAESILIRIWEILMFESHLKGIEKIDLWESPTSKASLTKEGMLSVLSDNIECYA